MKLNTKYGSRYNGFEGFLLGFIDLQYYEKDDFEAEENRTIEADVKRYGAPTILELIEVTEEVLHMPEFPWEYVAWTINLNLRNDDEKTGKSTDEGAEEIYKDYIRRLLDRFKAEAIRSKQVTKEEVDEAVSRGLNYKPAPETV